LRRGRAGFEADRKTLALGGVAFMAVAGVVVGEVARVWKRGSAELPGEAIAETAAVAVAGYSEGSGRENAMFNLLSSFVGAFLTARTITYTLRRRASFGPLRSLRVGRRHIHHFVPGIMVAFAAGTAAILTRDEDLEPVLAIPFGIGMGLTLDESALLLELDDVYWTREGVVSVQITLAVTAMLAALALGLRFLRRGEELVLEGGG
jgi:hypothetical protein